MNKFLIFFLLIFTFFSCNKEIKIKNSSIELKRKTFNLVAESEVDTLIFEFRDSTYHVFGYSEYNRPWRIVSFNNSNILVLDSRTVALKKINDDKYEGVVIGEKETKIELTKRESKWNKELLFGTWIEERFYNMDSTDFPPPLEETKTKWPPSYTINEKKIQRDFYKKAESEIRISSNGEFISMNLNDPFTNSSRELQWQIKYLTDSLLIVNRELELTNISKTGTVTELKNDDFKLIKKR